MQSRRFKRDTRTVVTVFVGLVCLLTAISALRWASGAEGGRSSGQDRSAQAARPPEWPQYLVFHVRPSRQDKVLNGQAVDRMLEKLKTRGSATRRLAFSCSISYLNVPDTASARQSLAQKVRKILSIAEKKNVPVVLHLDGVNWWGERPELWNWWDPDKPGYDPQNVRNVEWYDWGAKHAVKIGWRNWGSEVRVKPQPNLLSPEFLRETDEMLRTLVPVISEWFNNLPPNKKYLLGGVVLGWEISPYIQHYYYPDGNKYLEEHPNDDSHDPEGGIEKSIPLGYAAATVLGIWHEGSITTSDLDRIIRAYCNHITNTAGRAGLPRSKMILHGKVFEGTNSGGAQSGRGMLNRNAIEGWSLYGKMPGDLDDLLDELGGSPWAAVEVQPWGLSSDKVEKIFAHRNCRMVNIFNWSSVDHKQDVMEALRSVLEANPELLTPPHNLRASRNGNEVRFTWQAVPNGGATTLLISGNTRTTIGGILAEPGVSEDVTGRTEYRVELPPGTYYWMLVAESDAAGSGPSRMPTRMRWITVPE